MIPPLRTLEEFLAHAIAIEYEATQRYREFAAHFARRGELAAAGLCRNLGAIEAEHLAHLTASSRDLELPALAGEDYSWLEGSSPEAPRPEVFFFAATTRDLLNAARRGEAGAHRFFAWVERTSPLAAVRALAGEMAREELVHVRWIDQALGYGSAVAHADPTRVRQTH